MPAENKCVRLQRHMSRILTSPSTASWRSQQSSSHEFFGMDQEALTLRDVLEPLISSHDCEGSGRNLDQALLDLDVSEREVK